MPKTRSQLQKIKEKKAYGSSLIEIWLRTLFVVSTERNINARKRYHKKGIFPRSIDDCCNKRIVFEHFGQMKQGGWQADHVYTKINGAYDLNNLQALNWADNISKSDSINYLNKKVHHLFKKSNNNVEWSLNMQSCRKINIGQAYLVWANSRIVHSDIGVIIKKNLKNILVDFNGKLVKVYPDPELFKSLQKRK